MAATTTGALMKSSSDAPSVAGRQIPAAAQVTAATQTPKAETAKPSPPAAARQPATPAAKPSSPTPTRAAAPPAAKTLDYTYQGQPNSYWCGPAATRIALSARRLLPSQDALAAQLNTTINGTDSAEDTTRVLNNLTKSGFYRTREIPGEVATPAEMDRLQADAVRAISNGYAIVANVVGGATIADGRQLDWPGGHYITVVGYADEGRILKIADPANPTVSSYSIGTIEMANWIAQRGYSG
ncbi:C39 family peptidase [Phytohabitans sp. ZYX-F-186]|uniref:C39 family peptidase n=1 Tax=Phytohabitans maris TaxID=3071409 RepID=A0ABU0ZYF3_9ACTN|nr:C39 family peptidase [Phytohabitans sp. ZYX-F-186]MDQ7911002.1 C39 family peptidase [Phytohabitans sp. ZYX-F-186]